MAEMQISIERLVRPVSDVDLGALSALLVDAVDSGAAVSFMSPLGLADAQAWWDRTLTTCDPRAMVLAARRGPEIVGTVQCHPAWAPNQPHRADIAKLIVHRSARGQGLGERLMRAAEAAAQGAGFRLLTLDAKEGGSADRLYRRLGWTPVGVIPKYALDPDGAAMHGTVLFWKDLGGV